MFRLGIDFGGTTIKAGITDSDFNIVHRHTINSNANNTENETINELSHLCKLMQEFQNYETIGIGIPGLVNPKDGLIKNAPNLNLKNVYIKKELEKAINVPIFIDNDANCAALAEHKKGAGKQLVNSVTITLGTGIGGGIIINNQIFRGSFFDAGEFGHMIIELGGRACGCGKFGHWEAYSSASALEKACKMPVKKLFDGLRQGAYLEQSFVQEYFSSLCAGLANIIYILSPDAIIIGGGLSNAGDILLDLINAEIKNHIFGELNTQIRLAKLGNDAGIIGASMLGLGGN